MPDATQAFKHAILENAGDELLLYLGLVDDSGFELSGGDPSDPYKRVAVFWTAPDEEDKIYPTENPVVVVPGNTDVGGWRCYRQLSGGDDLGGKDFAAPISYQGQGTLIIKKDEMGWRFI